MKTVIIFFFSFFWLVVQKNSVCRLKHRVALDQKKDLEEGGQRKQVQRRNCSQRKGSRRSLFISTRRIACLTRCLRTRYPVITDDARDGLLDEATQAAAFLLFAELSSPTSALLSPPRGGQKRPGKSKKKKKKKDVDNSGMRARKNRTGEGQCSRK